MDTAHKVIWTEGIFLGQQHFQQWDRYWEIQQRVRFNIAAPLAWGLHSLILDEEALLNGRFSIKKCAALFPQGEWIDYDSHFNGPLNCELQATSGDAVAIYLCLPNNQQVSGVTGYQDSSQISTWKANYKNIADNFDNNRQREVLFGQPQLQVLRQDQAHEQFHALKIAEVVSTGYKSYELIRTFIPAVVKIQASSHLPDLISRLIEILIAKIRVLNDHCHQLKGSNRSYESDDLKNLVLLQSLNRAFVILQHWQQHTEEHPQQLYLALIQLSAELIACTTTTTLAQLPSYQHDNLTQTFGELKQNLCFLLDAVMPVTAPTVSLRRETDSLYKIENIDNSLLGKSQFYIGVFFQAEDSQWITQLSKQIKIAAATVIEGVVTSALPGVRVIHTQRPPQQLSVKAGYEYFYLEPNGEFWEQIKTERALGIFVPSHFISAQIDLVTVAVN